MKERKIMKKVFALALTFAMLFTMSVTVFAADSTTNNTTVANATGTRADKVNVTVEGLKEGVKVTLYQVASGNYVTVQGEESFKDYTWVTNDAVAALKAVAETGAITANEVTAVVNAINDGSLVITPAETIVDATGKFVAEVGAGAYIAVITGGGKTVYNPVFLTATYDEDGNFIGGTINVDDNGEKLYGSTAVAKKSEPAVDKEITGGTTDDAGKDTVSVGDTVSYSITPTLPSYPANAVNKTLVVTDTLSDGLTLDQTSITITLDGAPLTRDGNVFKKGDATVATIAIDGQKLYVDFEYTALITNATTEATAAVVITYKAVVNENAVVGTVEGNPNDVELFYTNDPSQGDDYDLDPDDPQDPTPTANGTESDTDSETVYTYQVAFKKVDEDGNALANATFGIYSDEACTVLVDTVVTDAAGLAVSSKVEAGTYYIKEITPPTGYSLNTQVYPVTASWATATTTVTETTNTVTYTAAKPSTDAAQVGWLENVEGATALVTFEAYNAMSAEDQAKYVAAYIAESSTTTSTNTVVTENAGEGSGVALLGDAIPNTPMASLPSTGGIGTFIFTIAGCLIMVAAVTIFMVSKKKASN